MTPEQIDAIQQLRVGQKWSVRKIARHLHVCRKTIRRYLASPLPLQPLVAVPANWTPSKKSLQGALHNIYELS